MQSRRLIFFLKIWVVAFATTLYFAQAIIAQSPDPRLIPLLVPETARDIEAGQALQKEEAQEPKEQKLLTHDFADERLRESKRIDRRRHRTKGRVSTYTLCARSGIR